MIRFRNFILILIILTSYLPFIIYGGFGSGDDLVFVKRSLNNPDFTDWVNDMLFSDAAARPLSSIFLILTHYLFKDYSSLYIISGIFTWLLSVLTMSIILKNYFDNTSVYIFFLLASFPVFATSIFSNPYLFTQYIIPILFWSLSLLCLLYHKFGKNFIYYFSGWFLLILSLLSLSYILPLLLITSFLPVIDKNNPNKLYQNNSLLFLIFKYTVPVLIISLLFFFFKVYLVKFYFPDYNIYGLSPINMKSLLQSLYFYWTILIEVPIMLLQVIPHMMKWNVFIASFFVFVLLIFLKTGSIAKPRIYHNGKLLIGLVVISLLSSSSIFFISHYPSSTFGFYNRMMLPSFILYSVLISFSFGKLLYTRWFIFPITISILWVSSIIVQLDNSIKSWETREYIMNDISIKLNNENLQDEPILIANMPYFLNSNYNNEEVTFCTWSFDTHLQFFGTRDILTWPVCYRIVMDPSFYPNHNILNKLSTISDDSNIWYYEYEEGNKKGILHKLKNKQALLDKFEEIKIERINYHPIILREKIRIAFRNLPIVWNIYNRNLPIDI
jgi:hypothetical protein